MSKIVTHKHNKKKIRPMIL